MQLFFTKSTNFLRTRFFWIKKNKKQTHLKKKTSLLEGCPQRRGVCAKVYTTSPKKPNSAKRQVASVLLSTKKNVIVYIPGIGHNIQKFSVLLIRGGRLKDVPGVNLRVVRGKYDSQCVVSRRQGRSKYGTKKNFVLKNPKKK